jgi:hypothetical protein
MTENTGPTESDLRGLVGYERRLEKMTRHRLALEGAKFAIVVDRTTPKAIVIRRILEAQGIDDDVLAHPEDDDA